MSYTLAALADYVYHRAGTSEADNEKDQAITLLDTGYQALTDIEIGNLTAAGNAAGLQISSDGFFYNSATGFVGTIVKDGENFVIAYRGTDSGNAEFASDVLPGLLVGAGNPEDIDNEDMLNNKAIAGGTLSDTGQHQDALKLAELALQLAGGDAAKVTVTGQSLGGGLAGFVGAVHGFSTYLVSPAPFKNQLDATSHYLAATRDVLESQPASDSAYNSLADYLKPEFWNQSSEQRVDLLDKGSYLSAGGTPPTIALDSFIVDGISDQTAAVTELKAKFDTIQSQQLTIYNNNVNGFAIHTIEGEILSALLPPWAASVSGTHFKTDYPKYDIGKGNESLSPLAEFGSSYVGFHSPSLHALVIRTEDSGQEFSALLRSDAQLRHIFTENANSVGPIAHNRTDKDGLAGSSSEMELGWADSTIVYRALWKAVGDEPDFWNYFFTFYSAVTAGGAAAEGIQANTSAYDTDSGTSVHGGVLQLSLSIMRDGLQNTQTLAKFEEQLGVNLGLAGSTYAFAGLDAGGKNPRSDRVILDLDAIKTDVPDHAGNYPYKDQSGRPLGVADIDDKIVEEAATGIFDGVTGTGGSDFSRRNDVAEYFGAISWELIIEGLDALNPWKVLVVQGGSSTDSFVHNVQTDNATNLKDKSHVIIAGEADDQLTGSTVDDYLLGAGGKNTFFGTSGADIVIGGGDEDTFKATADLSTSATTFIAGAGTDSADYTAVSEALSVTAVVENVGSQKVGAVQVSAPGDSAPDTLFNVERITLTNADDNFSLDSRFANLDLQIDTGAGSNSVDFTAGPTTTDELIQQGVLKINFSTTDTSGALVSGTQNITISADDYRNAPALFVDGKQLVGGSSFIFDYQDYVGLVDTQASFLRSPEEYELIVGETQLNGYLAEARGSMFQSANGLLDTGGSFGTLTGLVFGVINYGIYGIFEAEWQPQWTKATVGWYGERYAYNSQTQDLDIYWRTGTQDESVYTLHIDNFQQGDFGINLRNDNLDTGTGNDGELAGAFNFSLPVDTFTAGLASVGMALPTDFAGGSSGGGGASEGGGSSGGGSGSSSGGGAAGSVFDDEVLFRMGTDGADVLQGFGNANYFNSFTGNDELTGGQGDDLYFFADGDGQDTIVDTGGSIIFAAEVSLPDVTYTSVAGQNGFLDILVEYGQNGDSILLRGVDADADLANWTFDVMADYGVGASANQYQSSEVPTDGNDRISGDGNANELRGDLGDDMLAGYGGADTYFYEVGDGHDTIEEDVVDVDANIIQLGQGILLSETQVTQSSDGADIIITFGTAGGSITLKDQLFFASAKTMEVRFHDGSVLTMRDLLKLSAAPTTADQTIYGDIFINELEGGAGDDVLIGRKGQDLYKFGLGDGRDTVADDGPSADNDAVWLGAGILPGDVTVVRVGDDIELRVNATDILVLEDAAVGRWKSADTVTFADGTLWTYDDLLTMVGETGVATTGDSSNNVLQGTDLADTIDGAAGDDELHGGLGGDHYIYRSGAGHDTIIDSEDSLSYDRIILEDLNASDLTLARVGDDLVITLAASSTDSITVQDHYAESGSGIEQIIFANGDIWNRDAIEDAIRGDGVTTVRGTVFADSLAGTAGDDHIVGDFGDDSITGGTGDDILNGGFGNDTYYFTRGDGQDLLIDADLDIDTADRLIVDGYLQSEVTVSRDTLGGNVHLNFLNTSDQITLDLRGESRLGIDEISFVDEGVTWTKEDLVDLAIASQVSSGSDIVFGFSTDDQIATQDGSDTAHGMDGSDTYLFVRGDGILRIEDRGFGDSDTLRLEGYSLAEASFRQAEIGGQDDGDLDGGDSVIITFAGTNDRIEIVNTLDGEASDHIERIVFDAGVELNSADISNAIIATQVTSGDDDIFGLHTDDTIDGSLGNDRLYGKDGSDNYIFEAGGGADYIEDDGSGDADTLTISGYASATVQFSQIDYDGFSDNSLPSGDSLKITFVDVNGEPISSDQIIVYNTLDDQSADQIEHVVVEGGSAWTIAEIKEILIAQQDGEIVGFNTDDELEGGDGADNLSGRRGSDTYVFKVGDGIDRIEDNGNGTDTLRLEGYVSGQVTMSQINLTGTEDDFDARGDSIRLTFTGHPDDQVDLYNVLDGATTDQIEQIVFDDVTWTIDDVRQMLVDAQIANQGTPIIGYSGNETIEAGAGDDVVSGGGGSDTYIYRSGDGADTIKDNGGGTDILHIFGYSRDQLVFEQLNLAGAEDDDLVLGDSIRITFLNPDGSPVIGDSVDIFNVLDGVAADRVEIIRFENDPDLSIGEIASTILPINYSAADDIIDGNFEANTIIGGQGDDELSGKNGSDTYIYYAGDGSDSIRDEGSFDTDILRIVGYSREQVVFEQFNSPDLTDDDGHPNGDSVRISFLDQDGNVVPGDQIEILNNLNKNTYDGIERIEFDNGEFIDDGELQNLIVLEQETIGNDHIIGFDNVNTIIGGLGHDRLEGERGGDTYVFNKNDGFDIIDDNGADGTDTLQIHGYSKNNAVFSQIDVADDTSDDSFYGDSIEITFRDENGAIVGGDKIVILNTLDGNIFDTIEVVSFFDGELSIAEIRAAAIAAQATDGDDTIHGFLTQDVIAGGYGDDLLVGAKGADTYVFNKNDGFDTIDENGADGVDTLEIFGYAKSDAIFNQIDVADDSSDDSFYGNSIEITFHDGNGGIVGGDKIIILNTLDDDVFDTVEVIRFADGEFTIEEIREAAFAAQATDGDDIIYGFFTHDVLAGGLGNDELHGLQGNDQISGGEGNDTLFGGFHNDVLDGGSGDDELNGEWGDDTLYGGLGNDVLKGGNNADLLFGQEDADILEGGSGDDSLDGGDGDDTLDGGAGADVMDGGTGVDRATYRSSSSAVTVNLADGSQNTGNAAGDEFYGIEELEGSDHNDTLTGDDGNNILLGGLGDDSIAGGLGDDVYIFNRGDGHDTIVDIGSALDVDDRLIINGYLVEDVIVIGVDGSEDIELTFAGTDDKITLLRPLDGGVHQTIDHYEFVDGATVTVWTKQDLIDAIITGPPPTNYVVTHLGTTGADTITGSSSEDIINGLAGDDTLKGSSGADIYLYASGDGNDTIDDSVYATGDVLKLTDLNAADVQLSKSGYDLIVTDLTTGQTITGYWHFYSVANRGFETIEFADGSTWDYATIADNAWIRGTSGAETLTGGSQAETLHGLAGDDTLKGNGGADTYVYASGDGNDIINDNVYATGDVLKLTDLNAADVQLSKSGYDLIVTDLTTGQTITGYWHFYSVANRGFETIEFADGSTWDYATIADNAWIRGTSGAETLTGGSQAETLHGLAGDDTLKGNGGADTYVYASGDGNDIINDNVYATGDVLKLTDLNAADVQLSKSGYDLIVTDLTTGQTITGYWHFFSVANRGFETIEFADGSGWDYSTMNAIASIGTSNQADTVSGTTGDDLIIGLTGNDTLSGLAGADTFVFAAGDGSDTITDFSIADADLIDVSTYGFASNQDFSGFSFDGTDTIVDFNGTDQVTVTGVDLTTQTNPDDVFIFI